MKRTITLAALLILITAASIATANWPYAAHIDKPPKRTWLESARTDNTVITPSDGDFEFYGVEYGKWDGSTTVDFFAFTGAAYTGTTLTVAGNTNNSVWMCRLSSDDANTTTAGLCPTFNPIRLAATHLTVAVSTSSQTAVEWVYALTCRYKDGQGDVKFCR